MGVKKGQIRLFASIMATLVMASSVLTALASPASAAGIEGPTWNVSTSYPAVSDGIESTACPSTTTCYAVGSNSSGYGEVLFTTNSGETWISQNLPTGTGGLSDIACPSITTCYAIGEEITGPAEIVETSNLGSTWTASNGSSGVADLTSVACPSTTTCYVVGDN